MTEEIALIDLGTPLADPETSQILLDLITPVPPPLNPFECTVDLEKAIGKRNNATLSIPEVLARVEMAMKRNLPTAAYLQRWCTPNPLCVVCGDGPSLAEEVEKVRELQRRGALVISVNRTHDFLLSKGITPWAHVLLDANEWVADYVTDPRLDVRYLVASQCHPKVFDNLAGYPVFLWHAAIDGDEGAPVEPVTWLREHYPQEQWHAIPGPTTGGLRTPILMHSLVDAVDFHMVGLDSSKKGGKLHTHKVPTRTDIQEGSVTMTNKVGQRKTFETNSHMAKQVLDFKDLVENQLPKKIKAGEIRPFRFTFYGDGLLPTFAATYRWHADEELNKAWGGIPPRGPMTLHLDRFSKRLRSYTMLTPAMLDYQARMAQRYLRSIH